MGPLANSGFQSGNNIKQGYAISGFVPKKLLDLFLNHLFSN